MIFNNKKLEKRIEELEIKSKMWVGSGPYSEDVDTGYILYRLLDHMDLEVWWKIEENTGEKIVIFRGKKGSRGTTV